MSEPASAPASSQSVAATPRHLLISLVIGTLGGAVFNFLSLPLPWMLGAMAATAAAAIAGQSITMSRYLRQIMIAVIGVLLGSAFRPEMLGDIVQWAASLTLLAAFLGLIAVVIPRLLRQAGYDNATAYFSALPAGLTEMTIVGSQNGGDPQIIALTHTVRVLLVAFAVPFTMVMGFGYERPAAAGSPFADVGNFDLLLLGACAVIGLWVGTKLNWPAGALAGPLVLSAAVHLAGLTASSPPGGLVAAAQVVLGTSVGARFAGLTFTMARRTITLSAVITLVMLVCSGGLAFLVGPLIGINPMALLLALSPGGVTEMSLMALALNQDIAFVTTHHVVRIALIVMIGPAVYAAFVRGMRTKSGQSTTENRE